MVKEKGITVLQVMPFSLCIIFLIPEMDTYNLWH
mgnify:CR=1 FL=1